uniref:lysine--tRNA ligase n=1 Tax=mine drainage metagenome TaxID=410659 RepID=E6PQZ1_9ZZZZ
MTSNKNDSPADASQAGHGTLLAERRQKLAALRTQGPAYPNDFKPGAQAADLHAEYGAMDAETLQAQAVRVKIAGRLMLKRVMGKASFGTLQDGSGRMQIYVTNDHAGEAGHAAFKHFDLGDILGCEGLLFKTRTGELTVQAGSVRLLAKNLQPLPDKFHGLEDVETRYRQRYVDLVVTPESRQRFVRRGQIVSALRHEMEEAGFVEVETPMLHPIPGGANAKPFATHHNALDQQMFLRIAPELYLKRLLVGGFERVFEINRNFRNEGISVRHNPEFTMMEFYCAYWNHRDVMDYTEALIRQAAIRACGTACLPYQGREVDLESPFARLSVRDSLVQVAGLSLAGAADPAVLRERIQAAGEKAPAHWSLAELQFGLFEAVVEAQLWQPTFIVDYPVEVSPLARASDADPGIAERFELFATGREIANGFSELNDPEDQAARFAAQVANKDAGDEEAMYYDADYIRALEVGMPPAGGCGIGIDRLVMLLTDAPSIRDVILFPALRRQAG